jgi:transposase
MPQPNDLSRSLAALDENSTLIAVIEMSQSSWLVAGIVPGIERHPAKKLEPSEAGLLRLLHRWRDGQRRPLQHRPDSGRFRGGTRRLLAGPLAAGARRRANVIHPERIASRANIAGQRPIGSTRHC